MLRAPVAGRPQRIDHLFSTASFARPGLVIAVVLSGTGNDGTAGALVVKLNGGTVIAESDESAQWSAMPRAAVKAGTVDATRPASAIAPLVVNLAEGGLEELTQAMLGDVQDVARTIASSSGTDFTRYRSATLRRRIEKRRALQGFATMREYHDLLKRDAQERGELTKSLLLPVTELFRDPPAWAALAREVLPGLVERAREGETIRIWCAGCASGEEAYTMGMVLAESGAPLAHVSIVGTDLDPESIRHATTAVYEATRMKNVDAGRRARFFTEEKGTFRVNEDVRGATEFRVHDLTHDTALDGPFDIVVCRNVLIYFDDSLQTQVLADFEASLAPRGVVFVGRSEALPTHADSFEPVAGTHRVFRRRHEVHSTPPSDEARVGGPRHAGAARPSRGDDPESRVDAVVIEDPTAIILVVDGSWRIALANRPARDATSHDVVGKDLLDVFPKWRGSAVHDALRSTMSTGRSVRVHGVVMPTGFVDLTLETLPEAGERKLLLVAHPAAKPVTSFPRSRDDQKILREDLTFTNDEIQTANEELAAANEELQATNEELQATNEELSSLNEEFLSTNQNLASTNEEMQASADHAQPAADLLHAILLSRGDAIVACDASRNVTLVTPKAAQLLKLDPTAVGKPIEGPTLGMVTSTLDEWLDAAARANAPVQREMPWHGGSVHVTIEALSAADGTMLGWLLTWRPNPNMPATQQK